jgi:hypothetical protein
VQDNEPTMPQLPRYTPPALSGGETGGLPIWPGVEAPTRPAVAAGLSATALAAGLAASLVVNGVLLVALASTLLFAHAGLFSPPSSSTSHTPAASARSVVNPTSALVGHTPTKGRLQAAPSSVELGCDEDQDTQFVVLANTGTADVQWRAVLSIPADQAGVELDPMQGALSAGTSITLQIHSTSEEDALRGVIIFALDSSAAGVPASLNYTTNSCD